MDLTKEQWLELFGRTLQGAFANPANGHTIWDSYARQQLLQGIVADLELVMAMMPDREDKNV